MSQLPEDLPVQAALIWIATRSVEGCLDVFEIGDDKEAAMRVKDFGLVTVAYIIAKHRQPGPLTVKGKEAEFEVLDTGFVRTTFKKQCSPMNDYEFFNDAKELLYALTRGDIIASTTATGVPARKIDAMFWQGREFKDEVRNGHYHVVAAAPGREPLRDIFFNASDLRKMRPGAFETSKFTPQGQVLGGHRKKGRPPIKREETVATMIEDVHEGRLTPYGLQDMLEKSMAARYGVSRDTARKARNDALIQLGFVDNSNSDN